MAGFPLGAGCAALAASFAPCRHDVSRDVERGVRPVQSFACASDFVLAKRCAVDSGCALLGWCALADNGFAGDEAWLSGFLRSRDSCFHGSKVMAVDAGRLPARCLKTLELIGGVRERYRPINRNVIIVPEHDQLSELHMPGHADGFLRDTLHKTAITRDDIGVVINKVFAIGCAKVGFRHREPDRICDALSERACCRLNARRMAIFGVTSRFIAELTEIFDLLDVHAGIAGQMGEGINQH